MAYGSMSNDELYGDSAGQDESKPSGEPKEDQGEQSAILPKSLCPGMKPGDTIELKISEVRGDSYVVTYEKDESKEEEAKEQVSAPPPPEGGGQGGGMDSMMG